MTDPRYPIGPYVKPVSITAEDRAAWIRQLALLPEELREAVEDLSPSQLDTPYREGGWTVRQVVHHIPDSHVNAYVRMKLALTEEQPSIKPYDEARWSALADSRITPLDVSLALLEALHQRWVILWESLTDVEFARTYLHPESGAWRLDEMLPHYAWHGRHHVAHITSLRDRMGW
jgi:uncharacterized damage-inducible protein DinB